MRGIEGKVAVVTGAARGLGAAAAARLGSLGAHVVAVDVNGDGAAAVVERLPVRGLAVQGDVSLEEDVIRYMDEAVAAFGGVDLHHLNAGVFGSFDALPDLSVAEFERVLRINVIGQFVGIREAFRRFAVQGSSGAVVVTCSIAGLSGSADLLPYQTSKHALTGLVRGAALYGGPLGVRVNGVAPGIVPTDLFDDSSSAQGAKDDMVLRASTTPLRRAGTAEEIADAVAFLLSEESTYVTGQIVSVDGGATVVNTVRPSGGAGRWDPTVLDEATYGSERLEP
jgi:NAD(P)-dependent dehydrogenase (short-subunit alcohol dehydrogenase family)